MLFFSANISMLFTEIDFLERFAQASKAGFRAVECQFPYNFAADVLADRLRHHGLSQVLLNLPAGDWANGDRGIACLPDRVGEFQDGVERAIEYATALGCPRVNCLAGVARAGADRLRLHGTLVENLRFAARELKRHGIALMIEPLNSQDNPAFFIRTTRHAVEIIEEAGSDNLHLQFDVYHSRIMDDDVVSALRKSMRHIGHVQIADHPGRHEPGTGSVDFKAVFQALERANYSEWIGCEYVPATTTEEGLSWLSSI
jgi:hydroxypyruvate isomerase